MTGPAGLLVGLRSAMRAAMEQEMASAAQRILDEAEAVAGPFSKPRKRKPIRVVATVGSPLREIEAS